MLESDSTTRSSTDLKMALTVLLAICAVLQISSPNTAEQQAPEKSIWGDVPTWGLVIVGGIAAWIAVKTLEDIKTQTRNAKIAARAAKNSADAALKNAEAVINAERAWIMVNLQWRGGTAMRLPTGAAVVAGKQVFTTDALLECVITNAGKTLAWIVDKRIALAILDPKDFPTEPDLTHVSVVDPILEPIAPNGEPIRWQVTPGAEGKHGEMGKMTIVYGAVLYRDIFNKPRSTRFGYLVSPSYELERIPGNVTYNQYS